MKNLILSLILIVSIKFVSAQTPTEGELKSGKYYLKIKKINSFTGKWLSNEPGKEIEIYISTHKKKQMFGEYNYNADVLFVKIKKYMYKGQDIAASFIKELQFITTNPLSKHFSGMIKDTISNNIIETTLVFKESDVLEMQNKLPWFVPGEHRNDNKKGTVFYDRIIFTKKK